MDKSCCVCGRTVEREDAPVLCMGGSGYPRILCEVCEGHLDNAMAGRDYESIKESITTLSESLAATEPDRVTYNFATELLAKATVRAKKINAGIYDFSEDEILDEEGFDEIPEELLETEEDKELDREDEEKMKKFDKVYNIILGIVIAAFAGFMIWKIIDNFLLN